jgi:NOL1/NOP2/fmu family ribosome biogenesis protein
MFRKYPESQELWSLENVQLCHDRDIEIVDVAHKLLKKDGVLIYSTCTFAKEENEDIVSYLIEKYNYEQLDIRKELKDNLKEGFISKTYRFYPHLLNGEGQFLSILKKTCGEVKYPKIINKFIKCKEFDEFANKHLITNVDNLYLKQNDLYYCACHFDLSSLKVLNYGVRLGEIYNKRFIPNHNMFKAFYNIFNNQLNLNYKDDLVMKYLRGEQISYDVSNGFGALKINGICLGGFKANSNNLNNYYPKGLRNY